MTFAGVFRGHDGNTDGMKKTRVFGLVLWRGGLLLVVGYVAFQKLRQILGILDAQLEFAVAMVVTGVAYVFLSVVLERVMDARTERSADE